MAVDHRARIKVQETPTEAPLSSSVPSRLFFIFSPLFFSFFIFFFLFLFWSFSFLVILISLTGYFWGDGSLFIQDFVFETKSLYLTSNVFDHVPCRILPSQEPNRANQRARKKKNISIFQYSNIQDESGKSGRSGGKETVNYTFFLSCRCFRFGC